MFVSTRVHVCKMSRCEIAAGCLLSLSTWRVFMYLCGISFSSVHIFTFFSFSLFFSFFVFLNYFCFLFPHVFFSKAAISVFVGSPVEFLSNSAVYSSCSWSRDPLPRPCFLYGLLTRALGRGPSGFFSGLEFLIWR